MSNEKMSYDELLFEIDKYYKLIDEVDDDSLDNYKSMFEFIQMVIDFFELAKKYFRKSELEDIPFEYADKTLENKL